MPSAKRPPPPIFIGYKYIIYYNMERNRNIVRLTESQFNMLIAESVKKALNEIGDTPAGQYALGRLSARQGKYSSEDDANTRKYAEAQRIAHGPDYYYFRNGVGDQMSLQRSMDDYSRTGHADDRDWILKKKQEIENETNDLMDMSFQSHQKAKNAALKKQTRNNYSLKNFNEQKLNRIVSESIDKILKNK